MRFIDNCIKNNIFENHTDSEIGLIVAVSGGADSLALADLLYHSQRRFKLKLCIAHFEHGLRGKESIEDAEFVKAFSAERNLNCIVESGNVIEFANVNKLSIETAARELRYNFLENLRQHLNFDLIALAHHADDQAETILMRILRGTGSIGLSAMKIKSGKLIRPLLNFKKSQLEEYCQKQDLKPRIDCTNFEADATRNKIRLNLMPTLQEYNKSIVDTLCRLGESAAEDSEFIRMETLKIFPNAYKDFKLSQNIVKSQHVAIQRMLIRMFVQKSVGDLKDFEFIHFEAIRRVLVNNLQGVELPRKYRADLKRGWLKITCSQNR